MLLYAGLRLIEEVFSCVVTGGSGGEWGRMLAGADLAGEVDAADEFVFLSSGYVDSVSTIRE